MKEDLLFFIIEDDKLMRKIIADFIRQMVRSGEIAEEVEIYDSSSGEEALNLFELMFKTAAEARVTYRHEPITPLPGKQDKAIVICDVEMEPIGGKELLRISMNDEILRDMSFVMMTEKPDLGLVSELGELGVMNILAKPLTLDRFSNAIRNLVAWVRSDERSHYKKVESLLELGKYGEALTLIKNAESKYTNLKWSILRGRAHIGLNETQSAKSDFEQAEMGAHIASIIALKHMVEVYEAEGDTKKAIDSLHKLTLKAPNNVERRLRLTELFIEDDRPGDAKAVLDLLEMEKRIVSGTGTKVADLLEKAGFVEDAVNRRLQMVDDELDNFVFCNDVAIGLRKQGRYEAADDIYRKIINGHSKEATLWFNRAVNLATWGRKEKNDLMLREAIDHFRMALKLRPDYLEADRMVQQLKFDFKAGMKEC
ncbi:MAG: hypothetical protein ABSH41_24615 [Syntrophobacteraceae bacterium]